jgi:hypothetical protein
MRRLALRFILAAAILPASAFSSGLPRNDFLLVLDQRVGAYRYLDGFRPGQPRAYEAALSAFGTPTGFRTDGNLCRVTWSSAGLSVGFASQLSPCATAHLFQAAWYGLSLFGPRWHNTLGVKVGMAVQDLRRIFPNARFEQRGAAAWLLLRRRRDQELDFVTLAVVVNRAGRVVSIEVPAAYVY